MRHIAPALVKRLSHSLDCGYSGEKCLSSYRSGLRLAFERGGLKIIEPWMPGSGEREGQIAFPGLVFLQLLFGYRSLTELRQYFADCWWESNKTRVLINALFPRKPSQVYPLA